MVCTTEAQLRLRAGDARSYAKRVTCREVEIETKFVDEGFIKTPVNRESQTQKSGKPEPKPKPAVKKEAEAKSIKTAFKEAEAEADANDF